MTLRELHGYTYRVPSPSAYFLMRTHLCLAYCNVRTARGWYLYGASGPLHTIPFRNVDQAAYFTASLLRRNTK